MRKILVIVAHPDDETLGCGGTLFRHHRDGDQIYCLALSDGESSRLGARVSERRNQFEKATEILGISGRKLLDFPDNAMDTVGLLTIVKEIESYKALIEPDIVYTHHGSDLNVDHQITHQAVLTAFRALPGEKVSEVYTFQTPSSCEWAVHEQRKTFAPNHFVELDDECAKRKFEALASYEWEIRESPHPRSPEVLRARMQVAGSNAGVALAEEFFSERVIRKIH